MSDSIQIHLHLGEIPGNEFQTFWNNERQQQRIPVDFIANFKSGEKPKGGLAFAIPPEVVIGFVTSVITPIGAGMGKLLWVKLKEFFDKRSSSSRPDEAVIIIQHTRIVFQPKNMPSEPPPELLRAFQNGS